MSAELKPVEAWQDQPPSDPPASFYTALAKAQAAFQPIRRDRTVNVRTKAGGTYSFSYAPLENILKAVLPALNKEGFSLVQHVEADFVVTTVYHAAGRLAGSMPVFKTESGPQAYGSALTYARRYGVTLLLGICADDDDDANAAEGNEVTGHPNHVLTPEKRDKYLPKAAEAINNGDLEGLRTLVNEMGELWNGVNSFLSTKQRQIARDMLQAPLRTEPLEDHARKIAEDFRQSLEDPDKLWRLHLKYKGDQTLYIAVSAYLSNDEREVIRGVLERFTKDAKFAKA